MKILENRNCLVGLLLLVALTGACRKTPPPPPPPPPPQAEAGPAPTVNLTADPTTIERGQSTNLRWTSQNATELNLQPGIGSVEPQGARSVSPAESTSYTITVRGSGGSAQASVRVTVTAPPPPTAYTPPPPPPAEPGLRERFNREVMDAFFDYDSADIRPDARDNLTKSVEFLRANPNVTFVVEGHCDERGSAAYNLGLGDRRANSVKQFLTSMGIQENRMTTVSYGKERPFCTEQDESCWQQNRRGHLVCERCGP